MIDLIAISLLDGLSQPALLIGKDEYIAKANAAARSLLGEGIEGRPLSLAMRQPAILAAVEAALQHNTNSQPRVVFHHATHETTYLATVAAVVGVTWKGALCTLEDQTAQEQISHIHRDFVANVSHELRTPLTALLGFIETLQGAAKHDEAARERFLAIMGREAGRMNRLVRDLLSLSRVEAEERQRPSAKVDLAALAGSAIQTLRALGTASGVSFALTGVEGPMLVSGDADQLTQVLSNLIENAVKYGAPGKVVTVDLARLPHDPVLRGPAVQVTIIDQGAGIDPSHLPRLTERFYRIDSHRSREMGGTGLGLAIVKHILQRHRGRLRIESEKGIGSRFSMVLPAA